MSGWNNRIVKNKEGFYGIHEVYYNEDGAPISMTVDSVFGLFDSIEDLKASLELVYKDVHSREVFIEPENW